VNRILDPVQPHIGGAGLLVSPAPSFRGVFVTYASQAGRLAGIAIGCLLVVVQSLAGFSGQVLAADDSNIPGVPFPGSPVTGLLGGPIYDHVYSIDVPPASIILLSLTGDPGTDFDLYLFNSTATTVYIPGGQVAFSTGPTSTESITYPTISGGRFYIDLNGASNVEGHFRLVMSIQPDTTPPQATLRLDGGAPATADSTVQVTLIGTDDLSGVGQMQLSLDGQHWGAFVDYTPTFLWVFDGGDGPKQLWARVRDRAGNVSKAATAEIVVDTVPPLVLVRDPGPGGTAAGLRPTFKVVFSEAIDVQTWLNKGLVVQRADGDTIAGTYAWSAATNTGTFVPASPLVAGEPVACSLSGIKDLAGNPLVPLGTWQITPLIVHTITAAASATIVAAGAHATITGHVDGPVYGAMTVEVNHGTGWQRLGDVHPTTSGSYVVPVVVGQNSTYRVVAAPSQLETASSSPSVRIVARRGVVLVGVRAGANQTSRSLVPVQIKAAVTPSLPSVKVTLVVTRYDAPRGRWVTSATLQTVSDSGGGTAFVWRPTRSGSYRIRISTPSTPEFANGVSPLYSWSVTG
jgi:hypothetical protein